jgi:hypothetical protein
MAEAIERCVSKKSGILDIPKMPDFHFVAGPRIELGTS